MNGNHTIAMKNIACVNLTVNYYLEHLVNPVNGANIQIVEFLWSILVFKTLKKTHGIP